jgi:hypothetical protein
MTIPITREEDIAALLASTYPELTEAERQEVRLDLELVSRWLLKQVELENPALKNI